MSDITYLYIASNTSFVANGSIRTYTTTNPPVKWKGGKGWFTPVFNNLSANAYIQVGWIKDISNIGNIIPELAQVTQRSVITPAGVDSSAFEFNAPEGLLYLLAVTPANNDFIDLQYAYIVPIKD